MNVLYQSFQRVLQGAGLSVLCAPLLCAAASPSDAEPPGPSTALSVSVQGEPAMKVENNAVIAAVADGLTTQLAVGAGGMEGNSLAAGFPLGIVALTGAKVLIVKYADTLPESEKRLVIKTTSATWGGAAVNNLLVMIAAPPPLAIVAGIVAGIVAWHHTASQYDNQDRLALMQKEKQERLVAAQQASPPLAVLTGAERALAAAAADN